MEIMGYILLGVAGIGIMFLLMLRMQISRLRKAESKLEKLLVAEMTDDNKKLGPEALKALEKFRSDLEPFTHFGFHANQYIGTYERGIANLKLAMAKDKENAMKEQED